MNLREQIAETKQRILHLEKESLRVAQELNTWKQILKGYEALAKTNTATSLVSTNVGATEAIRIILGKYPSGLTAREIRDQLDEYGVTCGSERNFLTNIHSIVRRQKDIEPAMEGDRKVFRFKKNT